MESNMVLFLTVYMGYIYLFINILCKSVHNSLNSIHRQ
jgi:hypothetical protein